MTAPLPPVPQPEIVPGQMLVPQWQAWFYQLRTFLTATASGGGGLVPASLQINTTAPLAGGGDLTANRTLSINANGITNAFLAQMPTLTLKGNNTGVTANALDLTTSQVKTMLAISLTTDVIGTLQAAQMPTLSGDVTTPGASLSTTIAANAVTNGKLAQMPTLTIKGNNTGGTANALDLTVTQVQAMLGVSGGANPSASVGLAAVNGSATTFLRSDGAPALSQAILPVWTDMHAFTGTRLPGSSTSGIFLGQQSANTPYVIWVQSAGAADAKLWQAVASSTLFIMRTVNDAFSDARAFLQATRSGVAVTDLTFGNTTDNPTFTFVGTSSPKHGSTTLLQTSVALTNNAAAAAGTLLNAPVAGNPTKWIPINDNGTIRNIPAW